MKAFIFWLALFFGLIAEIWRAGTDEGYDRARKWLRDRR